MSDFAATCLIWVIAIWLGLNAVAAAALAVVAGISSRKPPAPEPEPHPGVAERNTPPKRTWSTEMGLRQPK